MTSNIAARAATAGELVKFRGNGQWSKLGLAIQHPPTVYTARVNQTFSSLDGVAELTYDGGVGTLANVLRGMTILIGSSAGAHDRGICRIRQLPSATKFYINEKSFKNLQNDDYLTVINAFAIWPRDIKSFGDSSLMDYDIEFGSLTNGGIIPRIGPLAAVVKLAAGTVTFAPPDPSLSAGYDGVTIVSYLFDAPGANTTSNMGTTSPSWTYNAAGEYRWSCAITDSLGRVTTAYRWVFVDPSPIDFVLEENPVGDFDTGYWSFGVKCFEGVTLAEVYDRALVTLYGNSEYYNGVEGSVGKMTGYENIKCCGWIDGESINYDEENGEVTFTVQGPGFWLDKCRAFPFELLDTSSAPSSWKEIQELNVDKAFAQLLFWMSTAPMVMDCFFSGDTTRTAILAQPSGSLLNQLDAIAMKIFAKPLVNAYGQLYIETDSQVIASADRAALPVVMDLTSQDWFGSLEIERVPTGKTAMVELGAMSDYDGATVTKVYSRAPGNVPEADGESAVYDDHIIASQDECNRISGCLLAAENNAYEPLEMKLSANNTLFDIAPRQVATLSVAAVDNVRGITLASARLIPRRVEMEWDQDTGDMLTNLKFEFETTGLDGVTYYPPLPETENLESAYGDMDFVDFPPLDDWFPPIAPPTVTQPCSAFVHNYFPITWAPTTIYGSDPNRLSSFAYFPCKLRSTGSYIDLQAQWFADAISNYAVYAIQDGNRVLTGSITQGQYQAQVNFAPISDLVIDGFEIALTAGIGSPVTGYLPGPTILETGISVGQSVGGTPAYTTLCVVNSYYCIEAIAGSWWPNSGVGAGQPHYNFTVNADSQFRVGGVGYTPSLPGFNLNILANCLYTEAVTSVYGRTYFQSGAGGNVQWRFVLSAGDVIWPSGSLTFGLRNAWVLGRRMTLRRSTLFDVCAI